MISLPRSPVVKLAISLMIVLCLIAFSLQLQPSFRRDEEFDSGSSNNNRYDQAPDSFESRRESRQRTPVQSFKVTNGFQPMTTHWDNLKLKVEQRPWWLLSSLSSSLSSSYSRPFVLPLSSSSFRPRRWRDQAHLENACQAQGCPRMLRDTDIDN